jgi:S-DNA-T family DNA segregation ATPase FtsK/SpoIIIE
VSEDQGTRESQGQDPRVDDQGPVLVDVDGDGVPDEVTPGPRPAPRSWPPRRQLVAVQDHPDDVDLDDDEDHPWGSPGPEPARGQVQDHTEDQVQGDQDQGQGQEDHPAPEGQAAEGHREDHREDQAEDQPEGQMVPVVYDITTAPAPERTPELQPVVPPWMRSKHGRRGAVRWWTRKQWHRVRFHGFRLPVYACRAVARSPRGALRAALWVQHWTFDRQAAPVEQALATEDQVKDYLRIRESREVRVRIRAVVSGVLLALALVGLAFLLKSPAWVQGAAGLVAVAALGAVGTDPKKPLVTPALLADGRWLDLTAPIVMRALRVAGLGGSPAKLDKNGVEIEADNRPRLVQDITRSANQRGYEVLVDLPFGKTAGDAAAAVKELASGLDVDLPQVFPEPVHGRARRVSIYVADEDPMLLAPHRSPMAKMPQVSVWDAHPLARTPIGREVRASLLFNSFLLGAVPRSGKSFAAKCLVAPGVLDPHCDLTVLDCGGGRDWLPAEQVAVDYVAGDEQEDLAVIVGILERLRQEARQRLAEFRKLSTKVLPEDKLTRALAEGGMAPHLIVLDELQNLLRASDKDIRKLALELLVWLAKTAPKAGYSTVGITQRPAAEVIPADYRDITTVRIALRTKSAQGSDAILGSYASARGWRSDRFREEHKGAAVIGGISNGRGGDMQVARVDLLTPGDFEKACLVGRQRRLDAGTLRGVAAGQVDDVRITVTIVQDVLAVWPGERPKVQAHILVARLKEIFPDRHAALDETALTRALKRHGIEAQQVWQDDSNRNGYALESVRRARKEITAD